MKREHEWPWRSVLKNEEKSIAGGNPGVGRAWNPEKVKSSGLPVRLKRKRRTCWGPAARDACHTVRSWLLMFLLVVSME